MRILYGVVGEGMGHAIRSRVVLGHLLEQGHECEVIASGRAVDFLSKHFDDVHRIHGLHMVYEDNRVKARKTVMSNLRASIKGVPNNIAAYFKLIDDFRPEVVVSDFETWAYLYGQVHNIPVISIDNMQIINRCSHSKMIRQGHRTTFRLTRALIKGKLPGCEHYLITTFFRPPIRKKRTTLVPPILRHEILAATATRGEHLLVYQTGEGYTALIDALSKSGFECRIYGMRRDITQEQVEGNLRYQPFSETRFIDDLASSRAVIASGGFTLMGEAVYLRKPMLCVPLAGQLEQIFNARYLALEGFGLAAKAVESPTLAAFVENLPRYEAALSHYQQDGNRILFRELTSLLDRAAGGVL